MPIRALSFDADQTLWDYRQVQQLALDSTISLMEAQGVIDPGSVDKAELQRIRDTVASEYQGRPHSLEEVREESFVHFLQRKGHATPRATGEMLAEHFLNTRFDHIRLYPEVADVMARLKAKYQIGLLTNGNTYPERCGLPDTFDAEVMGPSYGFEKPNIEAFRTVAGLLGVELHHIAHVGDDWDDVEGANNAGCISILIDRENNQPEFGQDADHIISNLNELEALLPQLR